MGAWKQFGLFIQIHDLMPTDDAWDYFWASEREHLSDDQINKMIARDRGGGTQPCPHCGAARGYALRRGRWRCFYCGQGEAADQRQQQQQDDPALARAEHALEQERKARSIKFGIQLWNDARSLASIGPTSSLRRTARPTGWRLAECPALSSSCGP
jgi:hypothetical protein